MTEGRILKLERWFDPGIDTPIIAEKTENGYEVDGEIITKEELEQKAEKRDCGPRLPKIVMVD